MARTSLKLPPGLWRNGTRYQSRGRWYDATLMRCYESTIRPMGGWTELEATGMTTYEIVSQYRDSFTGTAAETLADHDPDLPLAQTYDNNGTKFEIGADNASVIVAVAGRDNTIHFASMSQKVTLGTTFQMWADIDAVSKAGVDASTNDGGVLGFGLAKSSDIASGASIGVVWNWGFNGGHLLISFNAKRGGSVSGYEVPYASYPTDGKFRVGCTCTKSGNDCTAMTVWLEPYGGNYASRNTVYTVSSGLGAGNNLLQGDLQFGLHAQVDTLGAHPADRVQLDNLELSTDPTPIDPTEITLDGAPRTVIGWRGIDGNQLLAFGTNTHLYAQSVGILYDITPSGFTSGAIDTDYTPAAPSDPASVYGEGDYGVGLYGAADPAQQSVGLAAVWHLDTFGEYLVGCCSPNDGLLYFWPKDPNVVATTMDGYGGILTSNGSNVADTETVVIGGTTYTFKPSVSATANQVLIGDTAADSLQNLFYAIGADPTYAGIKFGLETVAHPDVIPTTVTTTQLRVMARVGGVVSIATTESSGTLSWAHTTLTAGDGQAAPDNNVGVVVTPERFVFALGANGEARRVAWPSQETLTDWTPSPTNTAGGFNLEGVGNIVAGRRAKNETLIWTDDDLHAARYIGGQLVYSFEKIGSKCGLVAPGAVAMVDTKAIWMGNRQFFVYDGYVSSVPSEVADAVFRDFNYDQRQKVSAMTFSRFGEVWWFYPSAGSSECNRAVIWNYRENHWMLTPMDRTCGTDAGALANPVCCTYTTSGVGKVFEHETGFDHPDVNDAGYDKDNASNVQVSPFIESGPIELGDGEQLMYVSQIVPDELTLGDAELSLYTAMYPTEPEGGSTPGSTEVLRGPFTVNKLTSVRFTGRQVRVRLDQKNGTDWRVGALRLDVQPAGRR